MLARLAENLFWAGRYLERAENTARMADVTHQSLLESPASEAPRSWSQLLEVLEPAPSGKKKRREVSTEAVLGYLIADEDNPNSINASVTRARSNLRSVREHLSAELWAAINNLYLNLVAHGTEPSGVGGPHELLSMVARGCQEAAGAATDTMWRDDGWRFLTLGRMLERAETTLRLLALRVASTPDESAPRGFHDWMTVLRCACAHEAYRHNYRAMVEPAHVLELLLLSEGFPRSVRFCLADAERHLGDLETPTAPPGRAHRIAGRARAELDFLDLTDLDSEARYALLQRLIGNVRDVSAAVADAYFRHAGAADLHPVGIGG